MEAMHLIPLSEDRLRQLIQEAVRAALELHQKPTLENDLITLSEAQRLLGISRNTLYAWRRKGLIKDHRVQRKCYFSRAEIAAALNRSAI